VVQDGSANLWRLQDHWVAPNPDAPREWTDSEDEGSGSSDNESKGLLDSQIDEESDKPVKKKSSGGFFSFGKKKKEIQKTSSDVEEASGGSGSESGSDDSSGSAGSDSEGDALLAE